MYKLVFGLLIIAAATQAQKNYKDPAEYNMYDAVSHDLAGSNFSKAITDLDAWKQKYPDSEFKDNRELFYVKSYFETKQFGKALDTAPGVRSRDLSSNDAINLLYMGAASIQQLSNPTPEQLAAGAKAARELAGFDYSKTPEGVTTADWAKARDQMRTVSQAALLYIALIPGVEALKAKDCPKAESALKRALEDYPYSGQASAYLGEAEVCLYKSQPEKISLVLYELARAASLDPGQSMVDPTWQVQSIEPRLEDIYRQYHGLDAEGLKELKELAVKAPFPPPGFAIKSAAVLAQEKQADFEKNNPELVLWTTIKTTLTGKDGDPYFTANMKDALVPTLLGVLVDAKPACHPTQLRVAIRRPDSPQALEPEVTLKLEKPLAGKPESGSAFRWEGIAVAFAANPFLLTMETDAAKLHGLELSPCAPAPARHGK
jgi:hypothetical protein